MTKKNGNAFLIKVVGGSDRVIKKKGSCQGRLPGRGDVGIDA